MKSNYWLFIKSLLVKIVVYILFLTFSYSHAQNNSNSTVLRIHINTIFEDNHFTADTLLILPLGNSITFDQRTKDPRDDKYKTGYRYPLYNTLSEYGLNFNFIGSEKSGWQFLPHGYEYNGGFPGIKDNQLNTLLETGVRNQPPDFHNDTITAGPYLETYIPDVILLHIGTNGNQFADGTSAEDIEDILNEVDRVENLFNKDIYVIVAKIINRVPTENYVTELNNNIDSMVTDRINNPSNSAYPDKLFLVDMQDSAKIIYAIDSMGTIGDGIIGDMNDHHHPNDKGYAKMALVWSDAIKTLFPKPFQIIQQPSDVVASVDSNATFSIHVNHTEPISFQWVKNGIILPGENDSIYMTNNLSIEDNNSNYCCIVSSKYYTIISDTVSLFVVDSTSRITKDLVAMYNFEEHEGTIIHNLITKYPKLNLNIHNLSGVKWIPHGLETTSSPQMFSQEPAIDIYNEVLKTNELTLEAWIQPLDDNLIGIARIFTISQSTSERNFMLAQNGNKFEIRLRTSTTNNNGMPSVFSKNNTVKDSLLHIVYTRKNDGHSNIYINGKLDTTFNLTGNFTNWDSTYSLILGDEVTNNRLWKGKFYYIGFYSRALSNTEIMLNYNAKFKGYNKLLIPPTNLVGRIINDTNVVLTWNDNENSEKGYVIERKPNIPDSVFIILDSVSANTIQYIDAHLKSYSSYIYRIKAFNNLGESEYSTPIIVDGLDTIVNGYKSKLTFKLYQNYPNPFNPTTNIKFTIPKKSKVQIRIFNTLGQIVKNIYSKKILSKGSYTAIFNGSNLVSGVYFYQLIAEPLDGTKLFIQDNKALLVK